MVHDAEHDVPEGAAVLPLIPPELGIHPLLLAVLHAVVFLDGSEKHVVHPEAALEAMEYIATYLQRLDAGALQRVREDLATLVDYARQEKWPRPQVLFLKNFLEDHGVGEEGQS
jgi:hypothetical protein